MEAPDWTKANLTHSFYIEMVDPLTLSDSRGLLGNVENDGTLTLKYYGDTRAGLTVTTIAPEGESDGWDGTAALRLVHEVNGWSETLFTGFVTGRDWEDESGIRTWSYELKSTLYGLESETAAKAYTVGKNAMAKSVLANIFKGASRLYEIGSDALDYRFGSATVYDSNKSLLSISFDVSDKANDRITVAGTGVIEVHKYTAPAKKTPDFILDTSDPRAVTLPPVSGTTDLFDLPGRVVVTAKKDDKEVFGTATVGSLSDLSMGRRGYLLDSYHSETDMTPHSQAQAEKLAKQYLEAETALTEELELSIMYRPLKEGQIIRLAHRGETANYLISTAALDLETWIWKLSLKKVSE